MPEEDTPSAPPVDTDKVKAEAKTMPEPAKEVVHDGKIPDDELPDDMPAPVLEDENLPKPPKLKKSPKGLKVVLIVFAVLAVAGAAGWFFLLRDSGSQPAQQTEAPAEDTPAASTEDDVPEATNTETFISDPYRTTFMYPKTWKVTEDNDNSILVESQNFNYKTVSGESKEGNFRVAIRKGATTADSEIIAKGVAIQASQKLTYTAPAPGQRTETNLSLFGKDKIDNFSFLLITSNFTLQKGDTLGPNFGKETDAFLISGGYSESGLTPGLASNQVSVDGATSTNAYKQALAIIQSLQIK